MPYPLSVLSRITANGSVYNLTRDLESDDLSARSPSVPAAKTGSITSRSMPSDDVGSITGAGGHGIVDADKIDVYWTDADGVERSRRNMTVGTVATNVIPVTGGTGDVLAALATEVTFQKLTSETLVVTGDDVVGILLSSPVHGWVVFTETGDTILDAFELELDAAGRYYTYFWINGGGVTNPLAGDAVGKVKFSHGDSTGAQEMEALVYHN